MCSPDFDRCLINTNPSLYPTSVTEISQFRKVGLLSSSDGQTEDIGSLLQFEEYGLKE
jgi:hypothetical protein